MAFYRRTATLAAMVVVAAADSGGAPVTGCVHSVLSVVS